MWFVASGESFVWLTPLAQADFFKYLGTRTTGYPTKMSFLRTNKIIDCSSPDPVCLASPFVGKRDGFKYSVLNPASHCGVVNSKTPGDFVHGKQFFTFQKFLLFLLLHRARVRLYTTV